MPRATGAPTRPGTTSDAFLGRSTNLLQIDRILTTITEDSKIAFAQWIHTTPNRWDRTKWLADAYPAIKRLNHRSRLDLTDRLLTDVIITTELDRLRREDEEAGVLTQRKRRQKLASIADSLEHPTRGFTDHIKAMELDAKLDGTLGPQRDQQSAANATPPTLNLFFLNTADVKPTQVALQNPAIAATSPNHQVIEAQLMESAEPDGEDFL